MKRWASAPRASAPLLLALLLAARGVAAWFNLSLPSRSLGYDHPLSSPPLKGRFFSMELNLKDALSANNLSSSRFCAGYDCWVSSGSSCAWEPSCQLYVCVMRLSYHDDYRNDNEQIFFTHESHLIVLLYDPSFQLVPSSTCLSLSLRSYRALPIAWLRHDMLSLGPEEPHLLRSSSSSCLYVLYSALTLESHRRFWVYSFSTGRSVELSYWRLNPERNWVPLGDVFAGPDGEELVRVLYRVNPTEVIECDVQSGGCRELGKSSPSSQSPSPPRRPPIGLFRPSSDFASFEFSSPSSLRASGISLRPFSSSSRRFFVGFLKSVNRCGTRALYHRMYLPHLAVFDSEYRLVWSSVFWNLISYSIGTLPKRNVIWIPSVVRLDESRDALLVTVNLQNRVDVFLELAGFSKLLPAEKQLTSAGNATNPLGDGLLNGYNRLCYRPQQKKKTKTTVSPKKNPWLPPESAERAEAKAPKAPRSFHPKNNPMARANRRGPQARRSRLQAASVGGQ